MDLRTAEYDIPKYSLYMVNRQKNSRLKFAVFIVPQGRETEWLFSTADGRMQLANSADCENLVVVHLARAPYTFSSLKAVQNELSSYVMELAPSNLPPNSQVPFLSVGAGSDEVGQRIEKCKGNSDFSGEYIVEDVEVNGELFRRLIFLSNRNLTQSEAKLNSSEIKTVIFAKQILTFDIYF